MTSPNTFPRTDCIERYCPHVHQNVPLIRKRDGISVRFSCLRADRCTALAGLRGGCAHGKTVRICEFGRESGDSL